MRRLWREQTTKDKTKKQKKTQIKQNFYHKNTEKEEEVGALEPSCSLTYGMFY